MTRFGGGGPLPKVESELDLIYEEVEIRSRRRSNDSHDNALVTSAHEETIEAKETTAGSSRGPTSYDVIGPP